MSKAIAQPVGGKRFAWLLVLVAVLALLAGAQLTATSAAAASTGKSDNHGDLNGISLSTSIDPVDVDIGTTLVFGKASYGHNPKTLDNEVITKSTATYSLDYVGYLDKTTTLGSDLSDLSGFSPAGMSFPGGDVTAFTTSQAFRTSIMAPGNPWTSSTYSIAAEELQHILTVGASEGIQNYSQAEISPRESVMDQTTTSILDASPQVIVPGERILEAIDLTSSEVPTSWVTPSLTKNGGDITVSESPRGYHSLVGSSTIATAMGAGAILLAMFVAIRRTSAKIATIISNGKSSDCRALSRIRGKPSQGWTFSG